MRRLTYPEEREPAVTETGVPTASLVVNCDVTRLLRLRLELNTNTKIIKNKVSKQKNYKQATSL